jgi:hypothetical protein
VSIDPDAAIPGDSRSMLLVDAIGIAARFGKVPSVPIVRGRVTAINQATSGGLAFPTWR